MTGDTRPLLAFGPPTIGAREKQTTGPRPQVSKPSPQRQRERLEPQFKELTAAFDAERARLSTGVPDEVDPALVVVLDLAGSIDEFHKAIDRVDGLDFLSELIGEQSAPDEDFYMVDTDKRPTDKNVRHSLYLMMSNASAIDELLRMFAVWQDDPDVSFPRGLNKFKNAFRQLTAIRRWGPEDRIRETGLVERWQERLEVAGQSESYVLVEIELWYRSDPKQRNSAQARVEEVITASRGTVLCRSQIAEISYHALLAELPIQQVHALMTDGAESIQLLATDEVMFVSPFTPMSIASPPAEAGIKTHLEPGKIDTSRLPRVALLDGLPLVNHDALAGRLIVDDPDNVGANYPLVLRSHGTAMASLIIHGDLAAENDPIDRPVYVRPIMCPQELTGHEQILPNWLLPDLLHRAVKRIVEGEGGNPAIGSIRIINLSIGARERVLVSRVSPVGRLLDWLAYKYNLLFIVSAGNHSDPITIPVAAGSDQATARSAVTRIVHDGALLRGILPPGDALNVLTIGATHADNLGDLDIPDTVWDLTHPDRPAHYSATGPGVARSVKPDLHHIGGRALYTRPVLPPDSEKADTFTVKLASTLATGPGLQVAAPGRAGATNNTVFSTGTSYATALVTREASRLFDILEHGLDDPEDTPLPDPAFHPLLVRALLVHASSWGDWGDQLRRDLKDKNLKRRHLTPFLGYGCLDTGRLGAAAINRAVLIAGGQIACDERHTYELPLPPSLRARAEWHRLTITLAYMAPTVAQLNRYRRAKVYFKIKNGNKLRAGERVNVDSDAVKRGSLQHEIIEGNRAMVFGEGETFPIDIECMRDGKDLGRHETLRYALVVSIETAEQTSTTIYDEVRMRLREQVRKRSRTRI